MDHLNSQRKQDDYNADQSAVPLGDMDCYHLGAAEMAKQMKEDTFKTRENIVEGLENFSQALLMLFEGKNFSQLILQVAKDEKDEPG